MNERTTTLGFASMAALGCAPPDPDFSLDDEADEGEGDGDSTGDGDTGPNGIPFELVSASMDMTGEFVAPVDGAGPQRETDSMFPNVDPVILIPCNL